MIDRKDTKAPLYKILDCHGVEMPVHYSGRRRAYEEALKMINNLNKSGEFKPYTKEKE